MVLNMELNIPRDLKKKTVEQKGFQIQLLNVKNPENPEMKRKTLELAALKYFVIEGIIPEIQRKTFGIETFIQSFLNIDMLIPNIT